MSAAELAAELPPADDAPLESLDAAEDSGDAADESVSADDDDAADESVIADDDATDAAGDAALLEFEGDAVVFEEQAVVIRIEHMARAASATRR